MWRSAFLSTTSIAALACCSSSPAKPDAFCGTSGASPTIDAVAGAVTLTYGNLLAGANNDCPGPGAPAGVVSVTIESMQQGGSGLLTLCIQRPDLLAAGQTIGTEVKVIDLTGSGGGCTFSRDTTTPPSGTASATGLCKNGSAASGFALTLDAMVPLTRTCGATVDKVTATIQGTVAVGSQ